MSQQLAVGSDVVAVYPQQYLDYIIAQVNSPIYSVYHPDSIGKEIKHKSLAASFVSRVLLESELIFNPHAHIRMLVDEMKLFGWNKSKSFTMEDLISGDVVVWDGEYQHIGFVVPDNMAISFYSKKGYPILHELGFEGLWQCKRNIIARYTLAK